MGCGSSKAAEGVVLTLASNMATQQQTKPKPQVVFVIGGPGSGKGTQCEKLVSEFGFVHLSSGDLLREEKESGSDTAKTIEECMKEGKLVSDEIVMGLIKKAMEKNMEKGNTLFLVDGFPRSKENLEAWNQQMGDFAEVKQVLCFDCPVDVLEQRIMERAKTSGRADDNIETLKKRFQTYVDQSVPVLDELQKTGKVVKIDSSASIDSIYKDVQASVIDKCGIVPTKPQVIFVLGGPGAGKGTQCAKLVEEFHFVHLSAGDLLREERQSGSETAKMIDEYIKEGKIVPVEVTINLLKKAMEQNMAENRRLFLIDGFPRNKENLDGWNQQMGDFAEVKHVLYFDCPEDLLEQRILERGKTSGRTDDNPESIKKRFQTYCEQTMPIIGEFEKLGKVSKIDTSSDVDTIYTNVKLSLKQQVGGQLAAMLTKATQPQAASS